MLKSWARFHGFAVVLALFGFAVWDPLGWTIRTSLYTLDTYQRVSPIEMPDPEVPIVFAEIDEAALDFYGQWPWPRTELAKILINLYEQGAAVVALDTIQAEPDRTSPSMLAEKLGEVPEPLLNEYGYADWDEFFADVLSQTPTVLALGADPNGDPDVQSPLSVASIGAEARTILPNFPGSAAPLPQFRQVAAGMGSVSILPDQDGLIRSMPMLMQSNGELFLSLSAETLRVAQEVSTVVTRADDTWGMEALKIGGYELPLDRRGQYPLVFSALDKVQRVSLADLGSGQATLAPGSLVVVGASALGLKDIHDSPVELATPGPLFHGAALVQAVTDTHLEIPLWADTLAVILCFVGGIWMFNLARGRSIGYSLMWGAGSVAILIGAAWATYLSQQWLIDYSTSTAIWIASYLTGLGVRLGVEESGKREIRKAFGTYLAPTLVDQIADNPGELTLGGETKHLTVMFADLRGFTGISEQYRDRPQELTRLVNYVMEPMTDAILNTGGTIDKYLGDCVMAFWNAPLRIDSHPDKAVQTAHVIQLAVEDLNVRLANNYPGTPELRVAIGVNTGDVVVGNFGSQKRFDYTCLGDPVNLCSRLEGLCRYYDVDVLVGEETVERMHAPEIWGLVPIDKVAVKGKAVPILVYWLQSKMPTSEDRTLLMQHEDMLHQYWNQNWESALARLEQLELLPNYPTQMIQIYRDRIRNYQGNPPGNDWDGVFHATSK